MELPSGNERQKDERSDDRMEYPEQCHQEPMLYTRLSHFWGKNTSGKKSFSIMSELLNPVPHQIQPSSIQYTAWNCSNIVEWPFYFALFCKVSDVVFTTVSRVSGRPSHVFWSPHSQHFIRHKKPGVVRPKTLPEAWRAQCINYLTELNLY